MTPPDDLLKRAKARAEEWQLGVSDDGRDELIATDYLPVSARELLEVRDTLLAALESDRALLRRIVEAWDVQCDWGSRATPMGPLIDEARARVGEKP